ncbi:enhancin, partial [Listeria grandensis]
MKKLLLTIFIACIFLGLGATKIHAEEIHTKEVFSLPPQNWIFNSGMNKGKYHDRQDFGFTLSPNTVLKVRQVNPDFKGTVAIRLLADADAVEPVVNVGSEWTTISSTVATVPFATTPYDTVNPKLEYVVESNQPQKPLPIYNYGDSEKQFFSTWDKYDCEYGLIKGKDFQLFVPKAGKEVARYTTELPSLDGVIDYYEKVFAFDNKMAGFDNSSPTNKLGKNRYFMKARKDGSPGILAYYSTNWTVHASPTGSLWFGKNSWGPLHEIAHGYQTGLDGKGMYTGEVFNNVFGALFQYKEMGKKEADSTGWLFSGNKAKADAELYKSLVKNPGTYESVSTRDKLFLHMLLLQKAGTEAFTKMYQGYRLEANQPGYSAASYFLPNELNRYYSEYSGYDFSPVLERWGYKMPAKQVSINRAQGYQAVASLADVVPESHLLPARALLDPTTVINSSFEMVTNQEIAPLGLNGALTIQLNTADVTHLKGTKILLKDGKKIVQEQIIKGQAVTFSHVPNGIYTVEFLGNAMAPYEVPQYYAYVKEAQNELTIPALQRIAPTNLTNQRIDMKGLGDKQVGHIETDVANHQVTAAITTTSPHFYFKTDVYVGIKIINATGKLVYEKEA